MEIRSLMVIRQTVQQTFSKNQCSLERYYRKSTVRKARQCEVWGGAVVGTLPSNQHQYQHRVSDGTMMDKYIIILKPPIYNYHMKYQLCL